jgi:hypothetical protein
MMSPFLSATSRASFCDTVALLDTMTYNEAVYTAVRKEALPRLCPWLRDYALKEFALECLAAGLHGSDSRGAYGFSLAKRCRGRRHRRCRGAWVVIELELQRAAGTAPPAHRRSPTR